MFSGVAVARGRLEVGSFHWLRSLLAMKAPTGAASPALRHVLQGM